MRIKHGFARADSDGIALSPALDLAELIHGLRPEWHQRAACRGVGTDAFFPERGASLEPALAYCRRCEVQGECLADAMALAGLDRSIGVWGGSSGRDRRKLARGEAVVLMPSVETVEIDEPKPRAKPRLVQPCGTYAAWQRHKRQGEEPCEPCREARRAQKREEYVRRMARITAQDGATAA